MVLHLLPSNTEIKKLHKRETMNTKIYVKLTLRCTVKDNNLPIFFTIITKKKKKNLLTHFPPQGIEALQMLSIVCLFQ